ncbi:MAG: ATP synthase F1 subunit gamma [Ignavibacteriales bacterium]|jgi:F-type H+-transporting ATPase subunit gamma|nr:ATP synthase F1 subunit gamma [Ignavibacteriaceae bacterium]NLH61895.1 ATP synthase F1 subunit gamma [Ignavibacteriales bacterium]HOJ17902.1 ATP synthase F1 subunit gamma [Ignavibacteriaceae bacterium]HPO56334.1 ATP synthase F1 subunit gamma [Ignavibacteriaceae bacterium]
MGTLRDTKRRISGIQSTQKITRAMKMVASAKLRRAQEAIINARPYAKEISNLLESLIWEKDIINNIFLEKKEVNKVLLVVVTSDKGLCGSFNTNLIKEAVRIIDEYKGNRKECILYCIGRKGYDYFSKRGYSILNYRIGIFSGLKNEAAVRIVSEIKNGFKEEKYEKVEIIYNEFKSVIQQKIIKEQYLPINLEKRANSKEESESFIFELSREEILNEILPKHLNSQIWRVLLESNAAELGAKMTAMENATSNAQELIRALKIKYNKERQAAITKELIEVVSGANALKG